jgi:FixJ family two-component response regulator
MNAARNDHDNSPRVDVIDDDDSFRTSLTRLLAYLGIDAVGYRCAGEYLLAADTSDPNCILLDMCMPGPSGLELLNALAKQPTSPPVILLTAYSDIPSSVHALKAGAAGFLTKPIVRESLLASLDRAIALDADRRKMRCELETLRARYLQLTDYEREIFAGIFDGKLNKQLAVTLGICERSVKSYRARVMRKMQVSSVAELVRTGTLLGIASRASADSHRIM